MKVGDELPVHHTRLSRGDLVNYSGVAGDANPIHWDEDIAKLAGLPDVIAHGMLTMGVGAGFASAWSGDPGAVTRYAVRLSAPAIVSATEGADIEFSGRIKSLDPATRSGVVIVAREVRWPEDLRPGDVERPLPLTWCRRRSTTRLSVLTFGCFAMSGTSSYERRHPCPRPLGRARVAPHRAHSELSGAHGEIRADIRPSEECA